MKKPKKDKVCVAHGTTTHEIGAKCAYCKKLHKEFKEDMSKSNREKELKLWLAGSPLVERDKKWLKHFISILLKKQKKEFKKLVGKKEHFIAKFKKPLDPVGLFNQLKGRNQKRQEILDRLEKL